MYRGKYALEGSDVKLEDCHDHFLLGALCAHTTKEGVTSTYKVVGDAVWLAYTLDGIDPKKKMRMEGNAPLYH